MTVPPSFRPQTAHSCLMTILCALVFLSAGCGGQAGGEQKSPRAKTPSSRRSVAPKGQAEPEPGQQDPAAFLARAIKAQGGQARLQAVHSVVIELKAQGPGFHMKGRVIQVFPGRFRQEQEVWNCNLVHVRDGNQVWKTIDGTLVEVEKHDLHQLEEQAFLARLSMLVGLARDPELKLESLAAQDGLLWLKVALRNQDLGPYYLGFNQQSMLLSRAHYETYVYGHGAKTPVVLKLMDYRPTDGIMVPWHSEHTIAGEKLVLSTTITAMKINGDVPGSLFQRPSPGPPVMMRHVHTPPQSFKALVLKNGGQDPSRAEDLLLRALKANHLVRSGPEHRIFSGTKEQILNVAYPVVDPLDRKLDLRRDMRVASYSVGTLLTLVVREASEKKLAAAEALLRKQAREDHETPAGGARRVIWSQTVTQVQLPLR